MTQAIQIIERSRRIGDIAHEKIAKINRINRATSYLALNALIEASRAGAAGDGFGVVAREVKAVSGQISQLSDELSNDLSAEIGHLMQLGDRVTEALQAQQAQRLADLALNMIDIVDRNLYERSCDVRWWATDAAVVDAVQTPSPDRAAHCSRRLGVILDSYTVYLDLWVLDAQGTVVATGRPERYPGVVGSTHRNAAWFARALATSTGQDFVCTDIERQPQLNRLPVATYSTAVRRDGQAHGEALGVLAIFFDWAAQSRAVVQGVKFAGDEEHRARALLLDSRHRVIAASDDTGVLEETFSFQTRGKAVGTRRLSDGRLLGFARTPGYETYPGMGWYGAIVLAPAAGADAQAGAVPTLDTDAPAQPPAPVEEATGKGW